MDHNEARSKFRRLQRERREKYKELTRDYDNDVYNPQLKELQSSCDHGDFTIIPMVTREYIHITCGGCGATVWQGLWDEMPDDYKNARVSQFP